VKDWSAAVCRLTSCLAPCLSTVRLLLFPGSDFSHERKVWQEILVLLWAWKNILVANEHRETE